MSQPPIPLPIRTAYAPYALWRDAQGRVITQLTPPPKTAENENDWQSYLLGRSCYAPMMFADFSAMSGFPAWLEHLGCAIGQDAVSGEMIWQDAIKGGASVFAFFQGHDQKFNFKALTGGFEIVQDNVPLNFVLTQGIIQDIRMTVTQEFRTDISPVLQEDGVTFAPPISESEFLAKWGNDPVLIQFYDLDTDLGYCRAYPSQFYNTTNFRPEVWVGVARHTSRSEQTGLGATALADSGWQDIVVYPPLPALRLARPALGGARRARIGMRAPLFPQS